MAFDFVSLVAAGDDPMAQVVISKAAPLETQSESKQEEPIVGDNTIKKEDLAPEVAEYIEALEEEVTSLAKSLVDAEASAAVIEKSDIEGLSYEALLSKADPAVKALIEKQQEAITKAENIAKTERDARLDREFISKAESLPMVGEDRAALAGLLRRFSEVGTAEDTATLEKMLSTANTQLAKSSLFAEFGQGGAGSTISKSVKAAADEIRKREPSLTIEQAQVKAYAENPDLFVEAMTNKEA